MKYRNYILNTIWLLVVLLLASLGSYAQSNTADAPYLNSVHRYQVATGGGDEYEWEIYESLTDANSETNGTTLMVRTGIGGADTVTLDIDFDSGTYSLGDYYLVYSEYSGANCTARRVTQIDIEANTFSIETEAGTADCNSVSGEIWDNSINDISAVTEQITVEFKIKMDKDDDDFYIDNWVIKGKVDITSGSHTFPAGALAVSLGPSNGSASVSGDESSFTLTVDTPDDVEFISDEVIMAATIQGDVTEDVEITLTLTSGTGYATSGTDYPTITDANIVGSTLVSVQTKYGIPNTSVITIVP